MNNPIRLPSKNYYLLLMEDLVTLAKETQQFGLSEREWAIFENFIDELIEKGFEVKPENIKEGCFGEFGVCPSCGDEVFDDDNYCSHCGQRLYWEN